MISCATLQHKHVDDVVAMHAQCFTKGWSADSFTQALRPGAHHCVVALVEGQLAGGVLWCQVQDEAEIMTLFVDKAYRNRGVGGELLRALCCHTLPLSRVFLEVNHNNDAAIALYEQQNFMVSGIRKGYYTDDPGEPQDALIMERVL